MKISQFSAVSLKIAAFSLFIVSFGTMTDVLSYSYNMRTIPENGLNVLWPVLHDSEYFTFKGLHSKNVTLKSVIALDCRYITDKYDENPGLILDKIELLILTQYALRGLNVQAMKPEVREDLAMAEIAKRLRQYGRMAEAKAFLEKTRVIPSIGALCHIVEQHTEDMLRQLYHVEQKWDRHKTQYNDETKQ